MKRIVIFGATSAIASAVAKEFLKNEPCQFLLVARNAGKLEQTVADLTARGAEKVIPIVSDLAKSDQHNDLFAEIKKHEFDYDVALIAYGSLGKQKSDQQDIAKIQEEFEVNFMSVVSILTHLANFLVAKKSGTIAVISSVAGDRGRQSNYIYGSAKGALTILLAGLRNRLYSDNVHVITIKPGFVDTPMTADIKKNFLFVKPEVVAEAVYKGIEKRKDIIYVPWFWRYIMIIIKIIPEVIFKKLSL